MLSRFDLQCLRTLTKTTVSTLGICACLTLAWQANADLESGIYQTVAGATAFETGDYVPNGSRTVPLTATLTLDLSGPQPLLTAVIHDAVLEGGSAYADLWLGGRSQPFELTVHSTGTQLPDGSYQFTGDYLLDVKPSGTQYMYDWRFASAGNATPVWNGQMTWAGGHLWNESISSVTIVPEPSAATLILTGIGLFWTLRKSQKS